MKNKLLSLANTSSFPNRSGTNVSIHYILFLLVLCPLAEAQSTDKAPPPAGLTAGIVEAVIGNGDLVPARFAKIFALLPDKAKVVRSAAQAISDALRELRANAYNEPSKALAEVECVKALIQIRPVFVRLATEGTLATDADE